MSNNHNEHLISRNQASLRVQQQVEKAKRHAHGEHVWYVELEKARKEKYRAIAEDGHKKCVIRAQHLFSKLDEALTLRRQLPRSETWFPSTDNYNYNSPPRPDDVWSNKTREDTVGADDWVLSDVPPLDLSGAVNHSLMNMDVTYTST
eukprot:PhF_6_TR43882/c0_g1_i1/m.67187